MHFSSNGGYLAPSPCDVGSTARALFADDASMNSPRNPHHMFEYDSSSSTIPPNCSHKRVISDRAEVIESPTKKVSHLKSLLVDFEKKNKERNASTAKKIPLPQERGTLTKNPSLKAIEISQTPFTPSKRAEQVPLNKVTEMKRLLAECERNNKRTTAMKAKLSSKQRVTIDARMNQIDDLKNWIIEFDRQQANSKQGGPKRQLDIPMNKVHDLKNWLIAFEKQNKDHFDKHSTKGITVDGCSTSHCYRSFQKAKNAIEARNSQRQKTEGTLMNNERITLDQSPVADVSALKDWLVEFERQNKAHYEMSLFKNRPGERNSFTCRGTSKIISPDSTEANARAGAAAHFSFDMSDYHIPLESLAISPSDLSQINDSFNSAFTGRVKGTDTALSGAEQESVSAGLVENKNMSTTRNFDVMVSSAVETKPDCGQDAALTKVSEKGEVVKEETLSKNDPSNTNELEYSNNTILIQNRNEDLCDEASDTTGVLLGEEISFPDNDLLRETEEMEQHQETYYLTEYIEDSLDDIQQVIPADHESNKLHSEFFYVSRKITDDEEDDTATLSNHDGRKKKKGRTRLLKFSFRHHRQSSDLSLAASESPKESKKGMLKRFFRLSTQKKLLAVNNGFLQNGAVSSSLSDSGSYVVWTESSPVESDNAASSTSHSPLSTNCLLLPSHNNDFGSKEVGGRSKYEVEPLETFSLTFSPESSSSSSTTTPSSYMPHDYENVLAAYRCGNDSAIVLSETPRSICSLYESSMSPDSATASESENDMYGFPNVSQHVGWLKGVFRNEVDSNGGDRLTFSSPGWKRKKRDLLARRSIHLPPVNQ